MVLIEINWENCKTKKMGKSLTGWSIKIAEYIRKSLGQVTNSSKSQRDSITQVGPTEEHWETVEVVWQVYCNNLLKKMMRTQIYPCKGQMYSRRAVCEETGTNLEPQDMRWWWWCKMRTAAAQQVSMKTYITQIYSRNNYSEEENPVTVDWSYKRRHHSTQQDKW